MKRRNVIFLALFTMASLALLAGSWWQVIPFTLAEDLGFITGALSVWLTVVENIWNFPIGIANDVFFFVLFWRVGLFADMSLQVLYVLLGFQGWYLWLRGGKNKTALKVSHVSPLELLILSLIAIAATAVLTFYLQTVQDSAPFLDALTMVLSLVAQYMLNKKFLENWYFWILADLIYIPLYVYERLYLTSVVYVVFLAMCLLGVRAWLQSKRQESKLQMVAGTASLDEATLEEKNV
ncbi:nicotinamide riboside transporter PnuC [Dictyobacter aurantiacus]|uniref:Nicotinamide mononucleotide transporter n=1 Tax=Dictyobacter aurantiacus TaxID=1936993 RepID=A0A401ZRS8_9CHLR|nr:nicotinamide riboside transporter PnuC [Dictyobacter aurantiacus]GCE09553.1 nicotinamide mononucleotide transporter [Dictyobacter aurantiacus]